MRLLRELISEIVSETPRWGRRGVGAVFVRTDTGQIGLSLRSAQVNEPGTYGTVGGAIDEDEDERTALAREIHEELGYSLSHAVVVQHIDSYHERNFDYATYAVVVSKPFVPRLDWESDGFEWFDLDELPDNLHFGIAASLKKPVVRATLRRLATQRLMRGRRG